MFICCCFLHNMLQSQTKPSIQRLVKMIQICDVYVNLKVNLKPNIFNANFEEQ